MAHPTIFLVRHGETEWNRVSRYQGWTDSPLTDRGICQAHTIGLALSDMIETTTAELISSPIGRASRTAEIIRDRLGRTSALRFDDRLREISLGSWEGLDRTELVKRSPGIFDGDGHYEWYFGTPDGETYEDFSARVADWLGWVDKPVIAVTHGIVSRVLRGIYAGLPRSDALRLPVQQNMIFKLSGGSIEELEIGRSISRDRHHDPVSAAARGGNP